MPPHGGEAQKTILGGKDSGTRDYRIFHRHAENQQEFRLLFLAFEERGTAYNDNHRASVDMVPHALKPTRRSSPALPEAGLVHGSPAP